MIFQSNEIVNDSQIIRNIEYVLAGIIYCYKQHYFYVSNKLNHNKINFEGSFYYKHDGIMYDGYIVKKSESLDEVLNEKYVYIIIYEKK